MIIVLCSPRLLTPAIDVVEIQDDSTGPFDGVIGDVDSPEILIGLDMTEYIGPNPGTHVENALLAAVQCDRERIVFSWYDASHG